jgi:hypothetical protein
MRGQYVSNSVVDCSAEDYSDGVFISWLDGVRLGAILQNQTLDHDTFLFFIMRFRCVFQLTHGVNIRFKL